MAGIVKTRSPDNGYSLVELMVALSLSGIVAGIFSLQLDTFYWNSQESRVTETFRADVRRSQAEAQAQGGRVIIASANSGNSYTIGLDLSPYDSTGIADSTINTRDLPNGFVLNLGAGLIFDPRGFVINASGAVTTTSITLQRNGATVLSTAINPAGVM